MPYDIPPPKKLPKPGYYYHFKHDPSGSLSNYAYYIYGVGHHTEDNCPEADAFMQVYRPLYENSYDTAMVVYSICGRSGCSTNRQSKMASRSSASRGLPTPRSLQSFGELKSGCTLTPDRTW